MPRGGRGGGRGRGRGRGGAKVPWEVDPELKLDNKPSELFPPVKQTVPQPLSQRERVQVAHYRTFRSRVHEGPLYTVLGTSSQGSKRGTSSSATIDPFEGMPTYTQRYQRKTRKTPKLDTRPYVLKFFPKELWSTLDPEHSIEAGTAVASTKKRKTLTFATSSVNGFPEDKSGAHVTDDEQRLTALEQNGPTTEAVKAEDDNEDEMRLDDDEVGEEGEDVDEDFEEDEEDMGDDYNAEGYFDAGEEDEGAGGGDGDDEGGYYN